MVTRRLCFFVLACGLLFVGYADCQSNDTSTTVEPTSPSSEPSPTSKPTEPTKTPEPTTTAQPTTHPTTQPANSTTEKPNTTTPVPMTTTTPKPEEFTWDVKTKNGTECLKLHMKAFFKNKNNTKEDSVEIPTSAKVSKDSSCHVDNETQAIVIEWSEKGGFNFEVSYTFALDLTDKEKPKYYLKHLEFVNKTDGETRHEFNGTTSTLTAHEDRSYKCTATESHELTGDVSVSWNDVQLQAFMEKRTDKKQGFSDAEACPADNQTSDIVPIAVGCALAGLVVIVLIAYLVGRRRSRQKGYQSV